MTEITNEKEKYKIYNDPAHPLLAEFMAKCKGSYKHCQDVAYLAESVGRKLNLNVELIKCAAFYHDIGKIINPEFFSENQSGLNIHDDLKPIVSYHIISRHVADSVSILVENDFPIDMIKLVQQHHGSSLVRHFYLLAVKAEETLPEEKRDPFMEIKYRYKHKAPQTVESAVLMICDNIEATAKALRADGKLVSDEQKKILIKTTIDRLKEDIQLDILTVGQERIIIETLLDVLNSIYHSRTLYADQVGDYSDDQSEVPPPAKQTKKSKASPKPEDKID